MVGHSYGAVVAMTAAARRPRAVRSPALIEPPALRSAEDHPVVAAALSRVRAAFTAGEGKKPAMSPEEYLRQSTEPYGMPVPEFTEPMLRAARTAMCERPCWDAELDLETLAAAGWPKVVINGTWETAHPGYRAVIGEAIAVTGEVVADRIGARQVQVAGTDHFPHRDRPDVVNSLLAET
ncbi:alpha/beta fold hydrolase [Streptomyces sp. IBSBF 3136]|uniref:alpha/beta fold hydrolase n=1 Tax=Streptomyces sp. IBSBF 3136 TaxID=2903524 RepID=UPI002FDBF9C2